MLGNNALFPAIDMLEMLDGMGVSTHPLSSVAKCIVHTRLGTELLQLRYDH